MYKSDELTSSLLNDIGNKNVCHGGPDFLSLIIRIIFCRPILSYQRAYINFLFAQSYLLFTAIMI